FFCPILTSIINSLSLHDALPISPEIEKSLINALYTSRVAGLIVSPTLYTEDFSVFDIFSESSRPLVIFDRVPKNYLAHKIPSDEDRKSTRLNSSHVKISYAVFCL